MAQKTTDHEPGDDVIVDVRGYEKRATVLKTPPYIQTIGDTEYERTETVMVQYKTGMQARERIDPENIKETDE